MFKVEVLDRIKDEDLVVKFKSYESALVYATGKLVKLGERYIYDERGFYRTPEEVDEYLTVSILGDKYDETLSYSEYVYTDCAEEFLNETLGMYAKEVSYE